jgi:hypothetical protein
VPHSRARGAIALLAGLVMAGATGGTATGATTPDPDYGPPYHYTTELMGQFGTPIPLKNMALLTRTTHGYRYRAGQQNSHLVVTESGSSIRFRDRGTRRWKSAVPRGCHRQKVRRGIAATCRVPGWVTTGKPLLVEVWPRLGDEGDDTVRFGAGPDFFNGHSGTDVVDGGAGNDWIRAGLDDDLVHAGSGNDKVVGMQGADVIYGEDGDDKLYGTEDDDQLFAGTGTDFVSCSSGTDTATVDSADRTTSDCETVTIQ